MDIIISLVQFIKTSNIIMLLVATLISNRLVDFCNSFIDSFLLPLFHRNELIHDEDAKGIETHHLNINGFYFKTGKFFVSLMRLSFFLLLVLIIYWIFKHQT